MPRYFFDTGDGTFQIRDEVGRVLADVDAVRLAALEALPDMARQAIPDGDHRTYSIAARDDEGARVYSASLTLRGRWPNQGGALDGVVDVLVDALHIAEQEHDDKVAEMIRNVLTYIGEGLAERVGHKAAGVRLN